MPLKSIIIVTMLNAAGKSRYQPGLPVSCSLRHPTASMGMATASWKIGVRTCTLSPVSGLTLNNEVSITAKTTLKTKTNRANHQYSERAARPEKTKYFARHVLVALKKPMFACSQIKITDIPQGACLLKRQSPEPDHRTSVSRPARRLRPHRLLKQRVSDRKAAVFLLGGGVFQRNGQICPTTFVQFERGSQSCNDPAESAQFRPLMHTPEWVFSWQALGEGACGCRSLSSHRWRAWRAVCF